MSAEQARKLVESLTLDEKIKLLEFLRGLDRDT